MFLQALSSFLVSLGFAILFDAPKKTLIHCGFVGMIGWIIYFSAANEGMEVISASFLASFFISLISHVFAKTFKAPVIIFTVGGIIPIVPGGTAYDAMKHFVLNQYSTAIELSAQVLLVAGAIALGIVFSEVVNQLYRKIVTGSPHS